MSLANEDVPVTDRAKAAEALYPGLFRADAERLHPEQIARAAAFARAEADQLRDAMRALATEFYGVPGGQRFADRVRRLADGGRR